MLGVLVLLDEIETVSHPQQMLQGDLPTRVPRRLPVRHRCRRVEYQAAVGTSMPTTACSIDLAIDQESRGVSRLTGLPGLSHWGIRPS